MRKRCIKKSKKSNQTNNLQKTTCAKICMPNNCCMLDGSCERERCFYCKNKNCKGCPKDRQRIPQARLKSYRLKLIRARKSNCLSQDEFFEKPKKDKNGKEK